MFFRFCEACANIAQAVEETITTPTPGIGYGRAGDVAACICFILGVIGFF